MKLEAAHRLKASSGQEVLSYDQDRMPPLVQEVVKALLAMSPAQLRTLTKGVNGISTWFAGRAVGKSGKGDLVVESSIVVDLTLTLNAMAWLSKHFAPHTLSFPKVYRLRAMSGKDQRNNRELTLTPNKPILSWTDLKTPSVEGRQKSKSDVIISIKNPKVIFSYKTVLALKPLLKGDMPYGSSKAADLAYGSIYGMLKDTLDFNDEHEVVVYHGTKPFIATLERNLSKEMTDQEERADQLARSYQAMFGIEGTFDYTYYPGGILGRSREKGTRNEIQRKLTETFGKPKKVEGLGRNRVEYVHKNIICRLNDDQGRACLIFRKA